MAHKRDYKPEDIAFPEQHIVSSELVSEMEKSYIEYAMSVIVGRALPDVRDGLKPVHRRILYAMYEDGLTRDKPYRKCATAVGDVLGRYHPHGDASVYDALVRMAQSFSLRYPLIDGHGNFGDVDGNPPAAYRYTEARLARMADEMLRDIDKDTVDWDPNFDETRKEPRVLPSRIPQLLAGAIASMTTLNKTAAEISRKYTVHAATDVTGFSFLGHLHEMMGGKLSCIIDAKAVPVLPGAEQAADDCLYTAAGQRNRNHTGPFVRFENVPFAMEEVLFDPQTSGGLLLAVAPAEAQALEAELQAAGLPARIVGEIRPKAEPEITVTY